MPVPSMPPLVCLALDAQEIPPTVPFVNPPTSVFYDFPVYFRRSKGPLAKKTCHYFCRLSPPANPPWDRREGFVDQAAMAGAATCSAPTSGTSSATHQQGMSTQKLPED